MEIQIKTTLRFYLKSFRIGKMNSIMRTHANKDVEQGNTLPLLVGVQTQTASMEISLPQDPSNIAILLLGIYPFPPQNTC